MTSLATVLDACGLDAAGAIEETPFVSPVHRATGNRVLLLDDAVVRVPSPDVAALCDPAAGVAAAIAAGAAGLGPRVRWSDAASGALVLERVRGREARIEDLWGDARDDAIGLLRRLHGLPRLPRDADLFERCDDLARRLEATDAPRPPDLAALRAWVADAGGAIRAAGRDRAPCHLHPVASNFLLPDEGGILAIDWDEAATADPWWDLGALLQECCSFDAEWAEAAERAVDRSDAPAIARLRLYGAADDVAWGLWAALLGGTSPRREIEFFKYASWRFMRARRAFGDDRMGEWLRQATRV